MSVISHKRTLALQHIGGGKLGGVPNADHLTTTRRPRIAKKAAQQGYGEPCRALPPPRVYKDLGSGREPIAHLLD